MSLAPRVGRLIRMKRFLQALPLRLWREFPEQVIFGSLCGVLSTIAALYKIRKYGFNGVRPWYRSHYDIVRPDDERALLWRTPEEYPAPFVTNRQNIDAKHYKRDYGWKSQF